MKTNSQRRAILRQDLLKAIKLDSVAAEAKINAWLVLQILDDFTELYHASKASEKENKKLIKRLEKIKGLTEV